MRIVIDDSYMGPLDSYYGSMHHDKYNTLYVQVFPDNSEPLHIRKSIPRDYMESHFGYMMNSIMSEMEQFYANKRSEKVFEEFGYKTMKENI